ncbi:MAG: DUF5606 domain-containing protein [Tannerellaceae bacterium]|nr:DUF5606 domain-containing protein [Tannerellaceae bacterium]
MFDTVIYISGRPGLFRLIARSKNHLVIEELPTRKRYPLPVSVHALYVKDITVFTTDKEEPLPRILTAIRERYNASSLPFSPSSASKEELLTAFGEVIPNFDKSRVHLNDICKIFKWYNILIAAEITVYEDTVADTTTPNT